MKSMGTEVMDHLFCPCRPSRPHSMNLKHPLNKKGGTLWERFTQRYKGNTETLDSKDRATQ